MTRLLPTTLTVLLVATGCAPAAAPEPPALDLEAERAALMAADRAWFETYAASDDPVGAFVGALVDDGAHLLPPNAPLAVGKEAIAAVIGELEAMAGFSVQWTPSFADLGSGGDLGYTLGTYAMAMEGPDGPMAISGKYITVWKRQADGVWKVSADMFNADGPPVLAAGEGS